MPASSSRKYTPGSTPAVFAAASLTRTAMKPMSLVSAAALIPPPPSKAMLNFRGRP